MPEPFIALKVDGLEELDRRLKDLPKQQAKSVLRKALRAGAELFKKAVVAEAPKDTGFMAEHFKIRTSIRGADDLNGYAYIVPDNRAIYPKEDQTKPGKKRRSKNVAMVARFKEFGTSKMSADPFYSRAFQSAKSRVMDAVIARLKDLLNVH